MDMFKLVLQCDVRKVEMLHYIITIASLLHHNFEPLYLCNVEPPTVIFSFNTSLILFFIQKTNFLGNVVLVYISLLVVMSCSLL